jgi:hypothetical protein
MLEWGSGLFVLVVGFGRMLSAELQSWISWSLCVFMFVRFCLYSMFSCWFV